MFKKYIIISLLGSFLLNGCSSPDSSTSQKSGVKQSGYGSIINYGKKPVWANKVNQKTKFRVLQLGDSHTAGGFFTDELRGKLQAQFGNGGIGWVTPNKVSGQRMSNVSYSGSGWKTLTSRKDIEDFPIGGVLANNTSDERMTLFSENSVQNNVRLTFMVRAIQANYPLMINANEKFEFINADKRGKWSYHSMDISLPVSYQANSGDSWEIGPINIENANSGGAIVSAMGINGSQFTHWDKWNQSWDKDLKETKADLIILAYGTNEAMNTNIDIVDTEQHWLNNIQRIQRSLPNASILIIGAPEFLTSKVGECGVRAPMLDEIQDMQKRVAQKAKVMFWSWEQAMGGKCTMSSFIAGGLAAKDGVHFSASGYKVIAAKLAKDIINLAK